MATFSYNIVAHGKIKSWIALFFCKVDKNSTLLHELDGLLLMTGADKHSDIPELLLEDKNIVRYKYTRKLIFHTMHPCILYIQKWCIMPQIIPNCNNVFQLSSSCILYNMHVPISKFWWNTGLVYPICLHIIEDKHEW